MTCHEHALDELGDAGIRLPSQRTIVLDGGVVVADGPTAAIMTDQALLEEHGLEAP